MVVMLRKVKMEKGRGEQGRKVSEKGKAEMTRNGGVRGVRDR